jgi:cell division protein ZapA
MDKTITINISLSDRSYRLLVEPGEEEYVRKAGKTIESMLKEYSNAYAYKDKQDLFAMVTLQNTTALMKLQGEKELNLDAVSAKLEAIDEILERE